MIPRPLSMLTVAVLWAFTTYAGSGAETPPHYNLDRQGRAIAGYDPVSYFTEGRAVPGRAELSVRHAGVTYLFVTPKDKELFEASPAKYLPAYGGWCATAMAKGQKVEIDPANFKVTNGRLFLFFKAFYADARKDWIKAEPELTGKADANWKRLTGE